MGMGKVMSKIIKLALFSSVFVAIGAAAAVMIMKHDAPADSHHEMTNAQHHGGMMGHRHDEGTMPGLQGKDTTDEEVNDLKAIFQNHTLISRRVENLPNGIKTVTESENEELRGAIVRHVTMMVTRLEEGQNPEVIIQSPTLDELFAVYQDIETMIEMTYTGIAVIQTSHDPKTVKFLQTHAAEVSDMAERGMQAVHERMRGAHH